MGKIIAYLLLPWFAFILLQGCGPDEEELRLQELARQDSLRQVYEAQMEEMRRDSLEQAAMEETTESEPSFEYSENGRYSVQIEAWRSLQKAGEQADKWKQMDFDHAYVVEYGNADKGDVWYRVRLGTFEDLDMARAFRDMLNTDYNTLSWIEEHEDK